MECCSSSALSLVLHPQVDKPATEKLLRGGEVWSLRSGFSLLPMKEPSLFRMKYRALHVLMYSPGLEGGKMWVWPMCIFNIEPKLWQTCGVNNSVLVTFTSFLEPALFDYINFIHGESCVSERVRRVGGWGGEQRTCRLGRMESQSQFKSKQHLLNNTNDTNETWSSWPA